MECLRLEGPGRFLAPVDYSCMGYSVPAAIGARLARPDAPVVALAGDGAFLMTGLELMTAAHYGIAAAVIVLRDRELAQIAQFQSVALNRRVASEVHDYDLARLCEGIGVECLALDSDDQVDAVLDRPRRRRHRRRPADRRRLRDRLLPQDVLHAGRRPHQPAAAPLARPAALHRPRDRTEGLRGGVGPGACAAARAGSERNGAPGPAAPPTAPAPRP